MKKSNEPETGIEILRTIINPIFKDDIEHHVLSPLSYLREFDSKWVLEFDLPLVNKKDISVSLDKGNIVVEAKLKETYCETNLGCTTEFKYFKKSVSLPGKLQENKITAKFDNGVLTIVAPKLFSGNKIKVQ